ncbi:MAG TPA: baseplate J/gp47 family protein, partial [Vicinamibacterales bacterium]
PSSSSQSQWAAASTLAVYVEGLRWTEVDTFFGAGPDDQIYLARQRDDGTTVVTFGDGVSGARLPTGIDNVVATYRFGAGAVAPPAFSIKQIVKPRPGLRTVVNPVAAAGGADAEVEESLRTRAPRTALLLGRAVSIQDFEAAAAAVDGVRAASAEWRWDVRRLRPVVQIRYIGAAGVEALVSQRVRAISDPSTPIDLAQAVAVPARLGIEVLTDPRRDSATVISAVRALLLAPGTGLLAPERVGIGRALFRSHILHAVLSVTGALAVRAITFDGDPFIDFGKTPGPGAYFDFERGGVDTAGSPTDG